MNALVSGSEAIDGARTRDVWRFDAEAKLTSLDAVEMARNFEEALKRASRPVEAKYYQRAGHNAFFTDNAQRDDEVRQMAAFYQRYLRN